MEFVEIAILGSKLLSQAIGISNIKVGESIFYGFLIICIVGWISLFGFMLINKPRSLKHWRVPNMVNISTIILVSLSGFTVSYLAVFNLGLFLLITEGTWEPIKFFYVVIFMIMYIALGLMEINKGREEDRGDELIPKELKIFIPRSIILTMSLVLVGISQLLFLRYTGNLPFSLNLPLPPSYRDLVSSFLILFIGIIFFIFAINQTLLRNVEGWSRKHPKMIFFSLSGIMFLLSIVSFVEKSFLDGSFLLVFSIITVITGLTINKILQKKEEKKEKKESKKGV